MLRVPYGGTNWLVLIGCVSERYAGLNTVDGGICVAGIIVLTSNRADPELPLAFCVPAALPLADPLDSVCVGSCTGSPARPNRG